MIPHSGSKFADKYKMATVIDQNEVTTHFKIMMFFKSCVCLNACLFYRGVLTLLKGAIVNLL